MTVLKFRSVAKRNPKNHMLNVDVKALDLENLTMALSGQPIEVDSRIAMVQDRHFVRSGTVGGVRVPGCRNGRELMHRTYVEIFSPKGEPRLRLEQPAWKPAPRIVSTLPGRLELEHIEETIENMATQPDFGYNNTMF